MNNDEAAYEEQRSEDVLTGPGDKAGNDRILETFREIAKKDREQDGKEQLAKQKESEKQAKDQAKEREQEDVTSEGLQQQPLQSEESHGKTSDQNEAEAGGSEEAGP